MAHIHIGNQQMVDREVLGALARLPDDFWVYGEFDCNRRNIDWLVIRVVPDDRPAHRYSTVILTELKRTDAQLAGGEYGRWVETRNGLSREIVPGNAQDENYWRQLINTVNQLRAWLFANQPRFLDPDGFLGAEQELKVWPNLLIVSPPDVQHRLPLVPMNRFGAFHFGIGEWFDKLVAWSPREGLRVTAAEAQRLAEILGLVHVPTERQPVAGVAPAPATQVVASPTAAPALPAAAPVGGATPVAAEGRHSGPFAWLEEFWDASEQFAAAARSQSAAVQGLTEWASRLEGRIASIERRLAAAGLTEEGAAPAPRPVPAVHALGDGPLPTGRMVTPEIAGLIRQAVGNIQLSRRRRDFPTLGQELTNLVGPRLRESQYFGFGTLRALMDEAVERGIVTYGPIDGNAPSIYLPGEFPA